MSDMLSESGQKLFVALKAVVSYMWNLPASQRQVIIDCFCTVFISSMDIHHCNELRGKFIDLFIIVRAIFCYRNRDLLFLCRLLFLLFSLRSYFYQLLLYIFCFVSLYLIFSHFYCWSITWKLSWTLLPFEYRHAILFMSMPLHNHCISPGPGQNLKTVQT